jgi:hypothetical protein
MPVVEQSERVARPKHDPRVDGHDVNLGDLMPGNVPTPRPQPDRDTVRIGGHSAPPSMGAGTEETDRHPHPRDGDDDFRPGEEREEDGRERATDEEQPLAPRPRVVRHAWAASAMSRIDFKPVGS